ncbi:MULTISPECIES: sensor histidine kinase [unclassified Romboutsia]|uniref:sensor histidine kinase n=1 Tax=unclassified Romboutsia TaxID=2626894 RepID=UPI0008220F31|nr:MULTISPECIES: HAMP domain-containing sensor histidine kinase [unclassified Romboutsia]SCH43254.1 Cell-division control histidine kinase pdhS [uncultured Clostridium sp.]
MTYKKGFSILLLVLFIIITSFNTNSYSEGNKKKVLILASYNAENEWEDSVITGVKNNLNDVLIKVEFLDSTSANSDIYNESFMKVLNIKYENEDIDCILTIDDEALNFAKQNLFNEESFMYKKQIVFVGANSYVSLNKEEAKYIKGLLEYQDNLFFIDTILNLNKDVKDIYLLLDKSIYCETVKENVKDLTHFTSREFNINVLSDYSYEGIKDKISNIGDSSAIILCGVYKDTDNGDFMKEEEIIKNIKQVTNAPIYTKLEKYVRAGALGGIINDGEKLGEISAIFLKKKLNGEGQNITMPSYNAFNVPMFNYKALRYYKINPLLLPQNSVIINKGKFDLLVPRYIEILILGGIFVIILFISILIYIHFLNKKKRLKEKELLRESIERDEIKTDFIITMSHELRTPLNIIINANKLLRLKVYSNNYDSEFFSKQISLINKNSNRLLRLINNLIDVSKIESGYVDATFKNENIVDIIEDATMSVVDLAKSYDIEIIFDTQEEEIITAVDRSKIERIMLNLLSNSIKFTDSGGHIYVNISKLNKNIFIEVKDDGIGMSEELQTHLFEKFRKAMLYPSLERANEGSGLGLFIVQGLVKIHKGTIKVESKLNEGTKFTITIPQVFVDKENSSHNLMNVPLAYSSKIELSDIYHKDD